MTDVVLHIGLHKTATRFLQRALFAQLDEQLFLVNPEPLFSHLKLALRHPAQSSRAAAAAAAQRQRAELGARTLVISDPTISGDMYRQHEDWQENLDFVHGLFPEARIVYCVRKPADWLHSAYRQALAKGRGVPIEFFLNFRDGEFRRTDRKWIAGSRNVNALELRFADIYRGYADRFGPEHVYLFRQEDLSKQPQPVYRRLAESLGLEQLPEFPDRISRNKAFSALAIHIAFPGVYRMPSPDAPNDRRWRWLYHVERRMRRLRTALIRHGLDRLFYVDWDLLARHGMRARLDAHYADEEARLAAAAAEVLERGPGPRARALVDGPSASATPESR